MDQVAQALGRTFGVYAAQGGFVLQVHDRRAAGRAGIRHAVRFGPIAMAGHADDFGNDIARLAHADGIADAQIKAADDVLVVQTGAGNAGPGQKDRVKHGGGGQYAGAADRDFDLAHDRLLDFGRILERDGPARELVCAAERFACRQVVDLNDCAVNVIGERAAHLPDGFDLFERVLDGRKDAVTRRDREAHMLDKIERLAVAGKAAPANLLQVEHKNRKPARRRDLRIFLPQRTGGRVARVFERDLVLQLLFFFKGKKCVVRHINFAAHLKKLRRAGRQGLGDGADGGEVFGHILPHQAVAACRTAHKATVLIFKADRKAVDLFFHNILRLDACFPHAGVKLTQLLKRESVLQAFHLDGMRDLAELAAGGFVDVLCRRRRRDQLRILGLDGLELPRQRVVFKIFQLGCVLHIIQAVVALNNAAQFFRPLFCLFQFHADLRLMIHPQ